MARVLLSKWPIILAFQIHPSHALSKEWSKDIGEAIIRFLWTPPYTMMIEVADELKMLIWMCNSPSEDHRILCHEEVNIRDLRLCWSIVVF